MTFVSFFYDDFIFCVDPERKSLVTQLKLIPNICRL